MIPRILHQVWVGPDPLPDDFARFRESWRRHHPDWEMRLWTEDELPRDLVRPEVYERLRKPTERSDIIRLEVLFRFGGVYVDTDFDCLRPIDPLIEAVDFFTCDLKPGRVNNAVIGSVSGHPLLERALRELRPRTEYGYDKRGTGPFFLEALVRDQPGVTIYPPHFFYPTTPGQREEAFAEHGSARSWKDPEDWRATALRTEERLAEARARIEELEGTAKSRNGGGIRLGQRLRRAVGAGLRRDRR
jgi:mannosyltransferase OCH1-like enzyme